MLLVTAFVLLTIAIASLIAVTIDYDRVRKKHRRACGELRSADALIAEANRQRDDSRREMERFKTLNAQLMRQNNRRDAA
jgi:uncharacterized membrane protein YccC